MKRHKAARVLIIAIVIIIQITFLTMIVKENYEADNMAAILIVVLIVLTLLFGHKFLDLHHDAYDYEKFSVAIWLPIGAAMCYFLNGFTDLGSILSASSIGIVASFLPNLNKRSDYLNQLPAAIYCGVFVGMSSLEIAASGVYVIAAGIVSGAVFIVSKNLFVGFGGKLGTIAFVGVVMVTLIFWIS